MDKVNMTEIVKYFPHIFKLLPYPGILLVTGRNFNEKNIMTIGWIQFGIVWQEPIVTIYVRPSRFSYKYLQNHNEFTLNILSEKYLDQIVICGSKSGSFCDKFEETGLTPAASKTVSTPSIKEAEIILECKSLFKTDIEKDKLNDLISARYYANNDYHQEITASIINIKINK